MEPRSVSGKRLHDDPAAVWNEFVQLLAMSNYRDLTKVQRAAHLVFWYEHEVQNGGHLQYFENQGIARIDEVIRSLERLGAQCQAAVLQRAAAKFESQERAKEQSVEEYVERALEGEFESFDRAFHRCTPSLQNALEAFLEHNRTEFVVIVD